MNESRSQNSENIFKRSNVMSSLEEISNNKKRKIQHKTSTQITAGSQLSFAPKTLQTSTQINLKNANNTSLVVLCSDEETEDNETRAQSKEVKRKSPIKKLNIYEAQLKKIEQLEFKAKKAVPSETEKKISALSKFVQKLDTSGNSDDDFDPRAKLKTPVKRLQKPAKKPILKRPRKQPDIRKMIQKTPSLDSMLNTVMVQECKKDNLNPDDVQLALAISKSLSESDALLKASNQADDSNENEELKTLHQKYGKVKRTLEGYGFKCKSSYTETDLQTLFSLEGNRRTRKPSFKPTLLTKRSKERQEALLAEKVQLLLDEEYKENVAVPIQEQKEYEPFSLHLEPYISTDPPIFYINSNDEPSADCMQKYYSTDLFPIVTIKAGYLLQNWADIPGRSRSPSPSKRPFDAPLRILQKPLDENTVQNEVKEPIENKDFTEHKQDVDKNLVEVKEPEVVDVQCTVTDTENIVSNIQSKLNDLQSNLLSQKTMAVSCEDLFAESDSDGSMMCFETNDSDDVKTGNDCSPKSILVISESEPEVKTTPESTPNLMTPVLSKTNINIEDDCILISSSSSAQSISQRDVTVTNEFDISKLLRKCDELLEGYEPNEPQSEVTEGEKNQINSAVEIKHEEPVNISIFKHGTLLDDITLPPELKDESIYTRIQRLENFLNNGRYSDCDSDSSTESLLEIDPVPLVNSTVISEEKVKSDLEGEDSDHQNEKTIVYFSPEKNPSYNNDDDVMAEIVDKTIIADAEVFLEQDSYSHEENLEEKMLETQTKNQVEILDDGFDEFDRMVYGIDEKLESAHKPESVSPMKSKKSSLAEDFSRAYSNFTEELPKRAFEVRTRDVTPPPDYETMDDIKLEWEMKRYGLKYIKKKEDQVKILNYIYSRTHPFIEVMEDDKNISLCLVTAGSCDVMESSFSKPISSRNVALTPQKSSVTPRKCTTKKSVTPTKLTPRKSAPGTSTSISAKHSSKNRLSKSQPMNDNLPSNNESMDEYQRLELKYGLAPSQPRVKKFTKTSPCKTKTLSKKLSKPEELDGLSSQEPNRPKPSIPPSIKLEDFFDPDNSSSLYFTTDSITSNLLATPSDELIFLPVKQKGKLQWCPLPLHIAFVNLLRANKFFKIKILRYEPFEIEVIYKYFKQIGARYELSDLKIFFDRKCITFRSEN